MRRFQKFLVGFVLALALLGGAMPTQAQTTARATTTIGVVTIRQIISGSLSFASGTTLNLADGTTAAPSLTFVSDPTTGLYRAGSGDLRVSIVNNDILRFLGDGVVLTTAGSFRWGSSGVTAPDLFIVRDAANTLAQRNGVNAQRFNVSNTYTSAINREDFSIDWQTASSVAVVGTRTAATGTNRELRIVSQDDNAGAATIIRVKRNAAPFVAVGIGSITTGSLTSSTGATGMWVQLADIASAATSGSVQAVAVTPTYNQSASTAANTDLLVNRTETSLGSGAQLLIDLQVAGSSKFKVDRTGAVTQSAGIKIGPSAAIEFSTKGLLNGGVTDGLFSLTSDGGGFGPQVNAGTAAPTVTTCGTGSVAAHSSNTAGEITATGATTCTVTFGAPNWTNTPFCIVEDETSAVAQRISAISISAFTVTALTSGDKFMYHCFGGI